MEAKKSGQHENLGGTNTLVVRQNRYESEGQLLISFNDQRMKLLNYSLFGIGIHSEREIPVGEFLNDVSIFYGSHLVSEHSFVVKRCKKVDYGYEVGLEILNSTIPIETILRIKDFNSLVSTLDEKSHKYKELPASFKNTINQLASRLEKYEKYTEDFSKKEFSKSRDYSEARESLIEIVSHQIKQELSESTTKLQSEIGDIKEESIKRGLSFFQENLGKFLFQSSFTKRSFEKPRGYAGDFEMMNQIYANDGYASTLFGSCMEKAVQSFGEPAAVRNRSHYLCEKILKKVKNTNSEVFLNFLSVASGPAEEVKLAVSALTQKELDRCQFHLLDQDEGALQFAQKNILEHALNLGKKVSLKLINRGIKEVIISGLGESKYDMIYSAGLFDYFTDPIATKAFKQLYKHLNTNSDLIIGNFNVATTNWFGMIALFDWSLILRSREDFNRLFALAGSTMEIESESNNINLFCCIKN